MKFIILISFLAAASAASFGTDHCTWGPAYWCDHPVKAKECGTGATKFCIENDWSRLTVGDDKTCDDCETFIKDVQDVLNSSEVQTEVIDLIKELCNKLGSEATTCKLVVDLYGKDFLEELVSELDPTKVCILLDLCRSKTTTNAKEVSLLLPQVLADPCSDCKQIFSDLKDLLSNKSVEQFVFQEVITLCEEAGIPEDLCKDYIDQYGPQVFKYILGLLDGDQICKFLGVCNGQMQYIFSRKPVSRPNADPCSDCKQIFDDLDDILSNKSVQQFVFQEVIMLCTEAGLPQDLCKKYIDQYGQQVFNYIIKFLDGDQICALLGVCKGQVQALFPKKVSGPNTDACTYCKQIFSDLDDLLKNSSVQQKVIYVLTQLCEELQLPEAVCQGITQYAPEVLSYLAGLLDPNMICQDLGVCSGNASPGFHSLIRHAIASKVSGSNTDVCTDCKQIFSDLDDILNNSTFQQFMGKELSQICKEYRLPEDFCEELPQFVPKAFSYLASLLDPNMICQELSLCSGNAALNLHSLIERAFKVSRPNADACSDCKQIFNDVDSLLLNTTVQQFIFKEAVTLCVELGLPADQCKTYVDQYGPLVLNYLVQFLDPDTVCQFLGVCPGDAAPDFASLIRQTYKVTNVGGDLCSDCKQAISDVRDMLSNKTLQQEVFKIAIEVCELTGLSESDCKSYVQQYGTEIFNELIQLLDPNMICTELGVCSGPSLELPTFVQDAKVPPTNGNVCTECKQFFADLSDILNNKTVQTNLLDTLTKVCKALRISASTCDEISTYGPLILDFLVSNLNGSTICSDQQMCGATMVKMSHALSLFKQILENDGDMCAECKQMIADASDILKNKTVQSNILKEAIGVCEALGGPSSTCTTDINEYGPVILDAIQGYLTPDICTGAKLCAAGQNSIQLAPVMPALELVPARPVAVASQRVNTCVICDMLMDILASSYPKGATSAKLETEMYAICKETPSETLEKECNAFVTNYADRLIKELIANKFDYSAACGDVGVCPEDAVAVPKANGKYQCIVCQYVMDYLAQHLPKNYTKAEIDDELDIVCHSLFGAMQSMCKDYINHYKDQIEKLLMGKTPFDSICGLLNVCPVSENKVLLKLQVFAETYMLTGQNKTECLVCGLLMDSLGRFYPKGATSPKLVSEMYYICEQISNETVKKECNTFVSNWRYRIIEQLRADKFDYTEVCAQLGVCPKVGDFETLVAANRPVPVHSCVHDQNYTHMLRTTPSCSPVGKKTDAVVAPKADSEDNCLVCQYLMDFLAQFPPKNYTKTEIGNDMEKACSYLSVVYQSPCKSFMRQYVDQIVKLLIDKVPFASVCRQLNACSESENEMLPNLQVFAETYMLTDVNKTKCLICDALMDIVVNIYPNGAPRVKFESKMYDVCNSFPNLTIVRECNAFVLHYGDQIFNQLTADKFDFSKVCIQLGICPKDAVAVPKGNFRNLCDVCQFQMDYLALYLPKSYTKEEIEEDLEKACAFLPIDYLITCKNYTTKHKDQIVKLLMDKTPFDSVCEKLKTCSEPDAVLVQSNFGDILECITCIFVKSYLVEVIKPNVTKQQVNAALDAVCILIAREGTECQDFIKKYRSNITRYLLSGKPVDDMCKELGICSSDKKLIATPVDTHVEVSVECVLCEFIMKELDGMLKKNATEKDIIEALDKVCSLLPETLTKECDAFVQKYIDAIVQVILAVGPEGVCDALGICSDVDKKLVATPVDTHVEVSVECVLCQFIVEKLDGILKKNATEKDIIEALDKVCSLLPETLRKECDAFVKNYTEEIVQVILAVGPVAVCEVLGICSDVDKKPVATPVDTQVESSVECVLCEFIMDKLDSMLKKNATERDIIDALEQVCSLLPDTLIYECDKFVKKYIDAIVQAILAEGPKGVCQALGICTDVAAVPPPAKASVGDSLECEICKLVMEELAVILKRNATKVDIENFLDHICAILPSKYKAKCDAFVAQYTPEILMLLEEMMTTDEICELLKLCTESKGLSPVAVLAPKKTPVGKSIECEVCDYIMDALEVLLKKNATKQDIEHFLENICNILPSKLKTECDKFIVEYTDAIIALLESVSPDEICQLLGLCTSTNELAEIGESHGCILCKFIMKEVDKVLAGKKSEAEIEKVLEEVCSLMPTAIRTECEDFVKEYAPQIIQLLLQFVSPDKVCDELKVCTSAGPVLMKMPKKLGGIACGPCEMIVGQVEMILKEGSTEREIEDFLKKEVCSKLQGEAKTACLDVVDKYLPEILQLVTSMTPEELCGLLGLCSTEKELEEKAEAELDSTAECMICELIVKEIRSGLSQNATEAEIQKFLGMVCNKIPLSEFAKDCEKFVDDYTKPIIQYLLAEMDPDKICEALKVCTPSKLGAVNKVQDDPLCLACDVILGMIEAQLEKNKSVEEVTKLIEKVCTILPDSLNQQCKAFLDIYGPVLLKLLINSELSPPEICKDLRLCTSTMKLTFTNSTDDCTFCKELVEFLEDLLQDHEDEILEEIAKLCDLLPEADQQECKNYIEVYGADIIDLLLEEFFGPKEVCKDLKFCNSSLIDMLPADRCKLGPTFWCASMNNAKLCHAVEHCRRHAWN